MTTSSGRFAESSRLDTMKLSVAELLMARVSGDVPGVTLEGARVIETYAPAGADFVVPTALPVIAGALA